MRESVDLSEGEEVSESNNSRILPRDVGTANGRNIPSRVVTRIAAPSAKADTFRSENLLPPVQIQEEDPANVSRKIASSRDGDTEIFVSHKWGHYEPIVDKPVEPEILTGKRIRQQRNMSNVFCCIR